MSDNHVGQQLEHDDATSQAWHNLETLWKDVSPICGDELVLVDADALLNKCFNDPALSIKQDQGFQLLHATYIVESVLFELRRINYHVAFFDDRAKVSCGDDAGLRLARACIMRHLQRNTDLTVLKFSSIHSKECQGYLQVQRPLFVATTDGADGSSHRDVARRFILHVLASHMEVLLLDDIEMSDGRIFLFTKSGRGELQSEDSTSLPLDQLKIQDVSLDAGASDDRRAVMVAALKAVATETDATLIEAVIRMVACMETIPVAARHAPTTSGFWTDQQVRSFTTKLYAAATEAMSALQDTACNCADLFDGRTFAYFALEQPRSIPPEVDQRASDIRTLVGVFGEAYKHKMPGTLSSSAPDATPAEPVLPFSMPIWAQYITTDLPISKKGFVVQDKVDLTLLPQHDSAVGMEKKLLEMEKGPVLTGDAREDAWALKRFQRAKDFQMLHIKKAAESLTGANGVGLERQPIIAGVTPSLASNSSSVLPTGSSTAQTSAKSSARPSPVPSRSGTPQPTDKPKKPEKKEKAVKLTKAQQIIAANTEAKAGKKAAKSTSAWASTKAEIDSYKDAQVRINELERYLYSSARGKRDPDVQLEMELYRVQLLLNRWRKISKDKAAKKDEDNLKVAVNLFEAINTLYRAKYLTSDAKEVLDSVLTVLGLEQCVHTIDRPLGSKEISFEFDLPKSKGSALPFTSTEFQLLYCGQNMERNMDSQPDPRTAFEADKWQRDVLDVIDRDESVFVVAPTSAGKTFISFYAMEKVLRADDEGILVFLAPTKALVNQMAAEIEARFSKNYKTQGGKTVWAIHSGDYKIHDPQRCQVLVTVPQVLQKLLMSPVQAQRWSPKIKRIVFDEIHCIGGEEGTVWEQLLLLAPCPIIALSATVGNPDAFRRWLAATQAALKVPVTLVHHKQRYSDLRKFVYLPAIADEEEFVKGQGISDEVQGGIHGIHPASALHFGPRKMPDDLAFEPRDCFHLYFQMRKCQTEAFPLPSSLEPNKYFAEHHFIRKADVVEYQAKLRQHLEAWLADDDSRSPESPFMKLMATLDAGVRGRVSKSTETWHGLNEKRVAARKEPLDMLDEAILPMLEDLDSNGLLPTLCFNYSRTVVERLGAKLHHILDTRETEFRNTDATWQRKIKSYEKWIGDADKRAKDRERAMRKVKKGADKDEQREARQGQEEAQDDFGWQDVFDPTAPLPEFSFAGLKNTFGDQDMKEEIARLESRNVCPSWMLQLLRRGIGVHHSGLNRRYRQLVELAFRGKFLRVVICTGTLALGLNMPATSSVFVGDNTELNALNFRQAAGRAGRRGYDVLGHVGFLCVPTDKIDRLLVSKIPNISGHFPISTTVVLRLCNLLNKSNKAAFAQRAIDSVFARCDELHNAMGDLRATKEQIAHQVRFTIEYLRRENLLTADGTPLGLSGPVSHLYYEEPGNLTFSALMRSGIFHKICRDFGSPMKRAEVCRKVVLILCHLFCRISIRPDVLEFARESYPKTSNTIVLPPINTAHGDAQRAIDEHEKRTTANLVNHVAHFVASDGPEEHLPISHKADFGGDLRNFELGPRDSMRTAFDLTGKASTLQQIRPFIRNSRQGVLLEDLSQRMRLPDTRKLTNAYAYDFFCAAQNNVSGKQALDSIIEVNGIPRSESWFKLQDFSQVLSSIEESMANMLGLSDSSEFDVMAGADAEMSAFDDDEADVVADTSSKQGVANLTSSATKVEDDWANLDVDESDDDVADSAYGTASTGGSGSYVLRDTRRVFRTIRHIRAQFTQVWKQTFA